MTSPRLPKTVHLTNAYHPTSGGVRSVYQTILSTANALGRPVRLIVPGERHEVEDVGRFGRIYFVKAPRAFAVDRRYRLIMPTRYLLPWVEGIRQILQEEQPDIVEVCDKHSLFYVAGLFKRGWIGGGSRPTLIATSAERFDDNVSTFLSNNIAAGIFARWFMRAVYAPMFDFHLANSEYTAQELRAALPAHRQHRLHLSPPSLSAEAFLSPPSGEARDALLQLTGGDAHTRFVVYVGRLSKEKNLGLLTAMLERLIAAEEPGGVQYRLLVAGEGPERPALEMWRERVNGRLHLLGNLPGGAAVRRLLASVDVFVHPNPREPFGIAPLEAMACGLPVVVPDSGGVLTYADSTTAWLARPTAEHFASAVQSVIAQPLLASARAAAARERAATFHEGVVIPRFFALMDGLHQQRLTGQAAAIPEARSDAMSREPATSR